MTWKEIEQTRLRWRPDLSPQEFYDFLKRNFHKRAIDAPPDGNWDNFIPPDRPPPEDQPPPPYPIIKRQSEL